MLKLEIELMYRDLHQNIFELILKIFASSFFYHNAFVNDLDFISFWTNSSFEMIIFLIITFFGLLWRWIGLEYIRIERVN